ncbi:MAG: hypothetical protein P8M71_02020 [Pseudomonadales bacterium]|nr:hypothetical protein [Pseudomonadales bacterium]
MSNEPLCESLIRYKGCSITTFVGSKKAANAQGKLRLFIILHRPELLLAGQQLSMVETV